jgi:hypothetical protein
MKLLEQNPDVDWGWGFGITTVVQILYGVYIGYQLKKI